LEAEYNPKVRGKIGVSVPPAIKISAMPLQMTLYALTTATLPEEHPVETAILYP
jgi:hypothetical protein